MSYTDILFQDTRFWEVFDAEKKSLGLFMYGDIIAHYTSEFNKTLGNARVFMSSIGHTMVLKGDVYPLEEPSDYPEIQAKKEKLIKRDRKRDIKHATKHGFKLTSKLTFGKYKGTSIQDVITNDNSYWKWLYSRENIIFHPELEQYR